MNFSIATSCLALAVAPLLADKEGFVPIFDGKTVPLTEGRIGLQAEWADLLYRNIGIKELKKQASRGSPSQPG